MRRHYAAQRAALRDALAPVAPLAQLQGLEAGLHAYLALRPDLDPQTIIARTAARGVIVYPLAPYYLGESDRNGVLLGYGGLAPDDVGRGARLLTAVIADTAADGHCHNRPYGG
jgi:GntR family transcriptional regulator / MocR family aminotransferase